MGCVVLGLTLALAVFFFGAWFLSVDFNFLRLRHVVDRRVRPYLDEHAQELEESMADADALENDYNPYDVDPWVTRTRSDKDS